MQISEKKLAANRANAKKSKGPTSITGLRNSSRNSTRHGILADVILLEGESRERFLAVVNSVVDEFQPETPTETTMVQKIAVAHWRQMRIWAMDSAGLTHEMQLQAQSMTTETAATRAVLAFRALSNDSRHLEIINRYEHRFDIQYYRAIEALARFRASKILPHGPTHTHENKGSSQITDPTETHPKAKNEPL
jgi:hypothetical protein